MGSMIEGSSPGRGWNFFSSPPRPKPALGPTQAPIQSLLGALSLGVKEPGREDDHSSLFSAQVKECVNLYLHSQIRLYGVVLS